MMQIERARESDVTAIGDLWLDMMRFHAELDPHLELVDDPQPLFEAYLLRVMAEGDHLVLVARAEGRVVGYLNARLKERAPVFEKGRHGEIIELTVAPDFRRQGTGRALVDRARSWFLERGVDRMEVTAADRNEEGVAFWRDQGFEGYFLTMIADIIRGRDRGQD